MNGVEKQWSSFSDGGQESGVFVCLFSEANLQPVGVDVIPVCY